MENKKTKKYEVENKRALFFWIGMTISLIMVISAFEWKSEFDIAILKNPRPVDTIDELVQITVQKPPQPPKPVAVAPVLIVVDDDEVIEPPEFTFDPEDLDDFEDFIPEDDLDDEGNDIVWTGIVESMPEPAGGYQAFYAFIGKNLKYPKQAQRMGIEGKVFIRFIVDKQGNITEVEVIRGIGMGCDEEALRVMKHLPKWQPGKQRGKPVKVRMVLPITFKLSR
jgi:periplasmic protein TonB